MEELIAKRYVKALLDISSQKQKNSYVEILNSLSEAFDSSEVKSIINSPIVSNEDKLKLVLDAIGNKSDKNLTNFIKILAENGRLSLLPAISSMVNMEIQKEKNEYQGIIISNDNLTKKSISSLEDTLKKYTGSKIKLSQEKGDIDGLKVSVEDLGIEVSFSKDRVKQQLIDFIKKSF